MFQGTGQRRNFMQENIYIKGFKSFLQLERALSENTVTAYLHDVSLLFSFLQAKRNTQAIKSVTHDDLTDFLQFINETGLGAYSQSRVVSGIKSFFGYLILEKVIDVDPSALLESPKLGKKLPDVLSEDEMMTIIQSVDLSRPQGERNKAILETLYACGLRVSELINLKISDIHFNQQIIFVTGKGNKQRLIPVGKSARKQLRTYIQQVRILAKPSKEAENIVFLNQRGGKMSRQMIFIIVKKQVERAGIHKKVSPHTFRHSFATHLIRHGADLRAVQELLGHVSISTTEIYTHLNDTDLRNTILKFHPLG